MFLTWLKARDAVEAGWALADNFPSKAPVGEAIQKFLARAAGEIRTRKLNFYKRIRCASAFKWRLVENGVETETAASVTQSLLVHVLLPQSPAAVSAAGMPAAATAKPAQRPAVAKRPVGKSAEARNQHGVELIKAGKFTEAEELFRGLLARNPKFPDACGNLGGLFFTTGRLEEAENCFRRVLNLRPTDLSARIQLARIQTDLGKLGVARAELNRVLKIAPRNATALYSMGVLVRYEGRFAEAEDIFQRALDADPNMTGARSAIPGLRKMSRADAAWLAGAQQAAAKELPAVEEASIRFAIGKYFDDVGRYEEAFASYARANELLKSVATPYDHNVHSRFVDATIRLYTAKRLAVAKLDGSVSTKPVFVIGMPRSGTSLSEQILSSHPMVAGAGELTFWDDVMLRQGELPLENVLGAQTRRTIADDYLRILQQQHPAAGYVVNKMPHNADFVGIIHSIFPHARFIYMRRDPIDTCLSCYFQNFYLSLNYTTDLTDLARYYQEHARLMDHWRKVLPAGTILDVPYEELVADQEHWTRKMLQFLGLEWDERCLNFHETERSVISSSYWQVRQGMYRDSVHRWRNYSKFVGPLRRLKPA